MTHSGDAPPRRHRAEGLRPAFSFGLWLIATLVAMSAIWIGVSAATRSVIGAPLPTLGAHDVASLAAVPTTTTTSPSTTTTIAVAATPATTTTAPQSTTSTTALSVTATSTTIPGRAVTTTTGLPGNPQRAVSTSFSNEGGVVNVTCHRTAISLDSAIPTNGYAVSVQNGGPDQVAVTFASTGDISHLAAVCREGRPVQRRPPPIPPPPPPSTGRPPAGG